MLFSFNICKIKAKYSRELLKKTHSALSVLPQTPRVKFFSSDADTQSKAAEHQTKTQPVPSHQLQKSPVWKPPGLTTQQAKDPCLLQDIKICKSKACQVGKPPVEAQ